MSDATPMVQRARGAAEHAPRIEVGAFPPWDTNAYLIWDGSSPEALILDPGMKSTPSLVERTAANQLRVHLTRAGFPVLGDALYGSRLGFVNAPAIALRSVGLDLTEESDRRALELPPSLTVEGFTSPTDPR